MFYTFNHITIAINHITIDFYKVGMLFCFLRALFLRKIQHKALRKTFLNVH
jgi:hypothetical protein